MKMHNYPGDITREQFEIIRQDLENAKKKTRPRKCDLYDIFCAVLYVNGECCLLTFQIGNWSTTISQFGQKQIKMELVFWIMF